MLKKVKVLTTYETYKTIRKTWDGINPVTRVEPNKKHYDRKKEKSELRKKTLGGDDS